MDSRRIVYNPHSDAAPKAELEALTAVYKFVLERKQAAEARGGKGRSGQTQTPNHQEGGPNLRSP